MTISLSENIKKLRTERQLTQEQLSEFLSVSPQTVSRWEIGKVSPDISLLPVIAAYFDISVDELLGVTDNKINEQISVLLSENERLNHYGKIDGSIALLKDGVKNYPHSAELAYQLAFSLKNKSNSIRQNKSEQTALLKEAIALCKRAVKLDDKSTWVEYAAKTLLCYCYSELGDFEGSLKAAEEMPSVWCSREVIIPKIHAKHDAYIQYQRNLITFSDLTVITLSHLARGKDITPQQCIELLEKAIKVADILTGDDHKFCNMRISVCYRWIAREYCKLKNADAAFKNLELALKYAAMFEERPEKSKYNAFWLSEIEDDKSDDRKLWEETEYERLLKGLDEAPFEFIRDDKRFTEIIHKIKEHIF